MYSLLVGILGMLVITTAAYAVEVVPDKKPDATQLSLMTTVQVPSKTENKTDIDTIKTWYRVDCANKKITINQIAAYTKQADLIQKDQKPVPMDVSKLEPNDPNRQLWTTFCKEKDPSH